MSKIYKVDVWFPPFRDLPEGTENSPQEIKRELICSDDEKRAYVREDHQWILFEIAEKKSSNPPGFEIECIYVDKSFNETDADDFLEGRLKKPVPGTAQHYTANHCTWIEPFVTF
jgi:hypothetical protein